MKRKIAVILAILIWLPTMAFADTLDIEFLKDIEEIIKEQYPREIDFEELSKNAAKGLLQGLDENSDYYTLDEAEEFQQLTSGEIGGIGVMMKEDNGAIFVEKFLSNSPAQKAGLKIGDNIKFVDNMEITGLPMGEIARHIRGEVGEIVILKVKRENIPYLIEVPVIREIIKINPISVEVMGDVGYIKIDEFSKGAGDYLLGEVLKLRNQGIDKIALDLRNNHGGLFSEAQKVANVLFPPGKLVKIMEKGNVMDVNGGMSAVKYKLVVLINEESASASEIIAGAVKDRKLGTLVGTKSYGKSTIQNLIPYKDKGLIRLTIGEYLTPAGHSINKKGIEPDIVVELSGEEDSQLKKALEVLNKK